MPYRRTFLHTSTHKNASTYRHFHSSGKKIEMTEGPLFGKILTFVLPLMVTNLLQVLYNAADMVVVSLSKEPDAVGAIGVTGSFINLVLNILMGFATGANVVIARHIGAKEDSKISRAVHTSLIISIIFGVISAVVGFIVSKPILSAIGAEGRLLMLAVRYTFIYFTGAPFISATNYFIAIFRAKGDTKTPLSILSLSGLCNVILNLFFVLILGMSVEGVALATTISNVLSAVRLCIRLSKDDTACKFSFKKLCFDFDEFKEILRVGLPAGVQGSLFSISNMVVQSSILQVNNMLAPDEGLFQPVVKGNAAAANLESFAYTAQNTVYQAAISFSSQNIGANKHERVYKIMKNCYFIGFCITLVFSLFIFTLQNPLLSLYGIRNGSAGTVERLAYESAVLRIRYIILLYFPLSFMEVGCGIVRGLGKAISSTVISLIGACALRVLWICTVFKLYPTLDSIYISYPITWIVTSAVFLVYSLVTLKKMIKQRDSIITV